MNDADRIGEVEVEKDDKGKARAVRVAFGPHYFVEIERKDGKVTFFVGVTHHGIKADASEVNGELERFVEELKAKHPGNAF
jgi:hypothetical protein